MSIETPAQRYVQIETAVAVGRVGGRPFIGFAKVDFTESAEFGYRAAVEQRHGQPEVWVDPTNPVEHAYQALAGSREGAMAGSTVEAVQWVWPQARIAGLRGDAYAGFLGALRGDVRMDGLLDRKAQKSTGKLVRPSRFALYDAREDLLALGERDGGIARGARYGPGDIDDGTLVYVTAEPFVWNGRNRELGRSWTARREPPLRERTALSIGALNGFSEDVSGATNALLGAFQGKDVVVLEKDYSRSVDGEFPATAHARKARVLCAAGAVWDNGWRVAVANEGPAAEAAPVPTRRGIGRVPRAYRSAKNAELQAPF